MIWVKFTHFMTHPLTQTLLLTQPLIFTHSFGYIFILPFVKSSSYSVSCPCSFNHSYPIILVYLNWKLLISLTCYHSLTQYIIYTHKSSLNVCLTVPTHLIALSQPFAQSFTMPCGTRGTRGQFGILDHEESLVILSNLNNAPSDL